MNKYAAVILTTAFSVFDRKMPAEESRLKGDSSSIGIFDENAEDPQNDKMCV